MSSKSRLPLAVKIARDVLVAVRLNREAEWNTEIVFEDEFSAAIDYEIRGRKLTPATLGTIIAHGVAPISGERHTMRDGQMKSIAETDAMWHRNGMELLRASAKNVIRAAMMDLIRMNNNRLMQQHVREVCPEL